MKTPQPQHFLLCSERWQHHLTPLAQKFTTLKVDSQTSYATPGWQISHERNTNILLIILYGVDSAHNFKVTGKMLVSTQAYRCELCRGESSIHRDQWGTRVSAWWSFMLPLCFSRHHLQEKNLQIMMNWWFIPSRKKTKTTEAFLHLMFLVQLPACIMLPPSVYLWGLVDQTELVLLSRCTGCFLSVSKVLLKPTKEVGVGATSLSRYKLLPRRKERRKPPGHGGEGKEVSTSPSIT